MFGLGAPLTFIVLVVVAIISGIKILKEYERGVVFRLGRMVGARGPGLVYVIPGIEKMVKMDLRTVTMDIPPQDVITRDNVSVKVNAVLYFRVLDPNKAVSGSRKLSFCYFSARASDFAQRLRPGGIGRALGREGKDQYPYSGDPRRSDRPLGNQSGSR